MNAKLITPAYILQVGYPVQPNRNKSFTFQHPQLSVARQQAFMKAQQIIASKSPNDPVDVDISLVEIDRTSTSDKHPVIATVVKQRFNRTSFMDGEIDLLAGIDRSSLTARSLPAHVFLTIGLEQSQEAGNSLEVVEKTLTAEETSYYRVNGYSISF